MYFCVLYLKFNTMIEIKAAQIEDYNRLMEIWENAVLATHDFLKDDDFNLLKELIPAEFFPAVRLFSIWNENQILAFVGVSDDNLEMLFVDAESRGKHIGKTAVEFVINTLNIYKVDVNEQNDQAVGFYKKMGYTQIGRSELDGMGKPYPLLHFEYSAK